MAESFYHKIKCWLLGIPCCTSMSSKLYEYSEDQLNPRWAKRMRKHLSLCKPCVRILDSYLATRKLALQHRQEVCLSAEQKEAVLKNLEPKD